MKRVLVFIGLKVAEIGGLFLIGWCICKITHFCETFFLEKFLLILMCLWGVFLFVGGIVVLVVNWHWAGEICEKKFNKKA